MKLLCIIFIVQCTIFLASIVGKSSLQPPPFMQKVAMARYVVHQTNWSVISTISKPFDGIPFGNVESFSDGPIGNSSGIPYFYLSPFDFALKDIVQHPQVTATMTLSQTGYCFSKHYDPEDPRCARVTVMGNLVKVTKAKELQFSQHALFSRHPAMKSWPKGHHFAIYKINITAVVALDFFGGADIIPAATYFAAKP
ncbi:uncharacterized protein TRIADDRAFT_57327 [Trichoplax adhaerens]|uniref:CREG-like beta-barrel domain-containing protein n=1 Tax=Trichoplax adhaerens TaxID=10228 RepID=B3RZ50_TRIAD|nr:hypothetical protein TRIADDRAFT_57327 [Trichoplax adhaerens]EDV23781.1 hypothetical protein TRIADDRAFT_57327 [Trichoplax adhaerens]|eukprot:XP_002113307.1 hypothetical protein TRIADDRAFT_57327 [Trichoplax adhaerens]